MLFSLNFVKLMDKFCEVFAAHEQVIDSKGFRYQKAGIMLLLFTTIQIWYHSKVFFLRVPKTYVVLTNGICLTLCQ